MPSSFLLFGVKVNKHVFELNLFFTCKILSPSFLSLAGNKTLLIDPSKLYQLPGNISERLAYRRGRGVVDKHVGAARVVGLA